MTQRQTPVTLPPPPLPYAANTTVFSKRPAIPSTQTTQQSESSQSIQEIQHSRYIPPQPQSPTPQMSQEKDGSNNNILSGIKSAVILFVGTSLVALWWFGRWKPSILWDKTNTDSDACTLGEKDGNTSSFVLYPNMSLKRLFVACLCSGIVAVIVFTLIHISGPMSVVSTVHNLGRRALAGF